jgi:hypothetical protein
MFATNTTQIEMQGLQNHLIIFNQHCCQLVYKIVLLFNFYTHLLKSTGSAIVEMETRVQSKK